MLSKKEEDFIMYWESVRLTQNSFMSKLIRGIPMSIIFTFPVLLSVALVYFLSPEWYTKISQNLNGSFAPILIGLFLCVMFFSFFRMHFKWEMNEQMYQELISKKKTLHNNLTSK